MILFWSQDMRARHWKLLLDQEASETSVPLVSDSLSLLPEEIVPLKAFESPILDVDLDMYYIQQSTNTIESVNTVQVHYLASDSSMDGLTSVDLLLRGR